MLNNVNNLEAVKVKLAEITDLFQKFVDSQNAYHCELVDEAQKEQSNAYFSEIEASLRFFCDTVNDWLRVTEVKLHEMAITPEDSASQVIPYEQHKHKSSCGSILSRASKASSISPARAEEAAKIAEIQAEALALRQRQRLHETEMNLKRQQYELELKREELKLETKNAKAVAREGAYAKAESKLLPPDGLQSRMFSSFPPPVFVSKDKQKGAKSRPEKIPDERTVSSTSSEDSGKSGLSDQAYQILVQQN